MLLLKELDQLLLDLAWSLWSELGVAGVKRNHQDVLILLEELVLLTVILSEVDPRLRDESLDWISQYSHLISISRLKSLLRDFEGLLKEPFSKYATALNSISQANWPIFVDLPTLKITPSRKSCLRPLESPALLNIRVRSVFGTGARADIITFCLTHTRSDHSISEVTEIGYSKRNLAEILEELNLGGIFNKFTKGNQYRYQFIKHGQLHEILKPIPKYAPDWRLIFKVLLVLRDCIKRVESTSKSSQVVEIRNCLFSLHEVLQRLQITPPSFKNNLDMYMDSFRKWILDLVIKLNKGSS